MQRGRRPIFGPAKIGANLRKLDVLFPGSLIDLGVGTDLPAGEEDAHSRVPEERHLRVIGERQFDAQTVRFPLQYFLRLQDFRPVLRNHGCKPEVADIGIRVELAAHDARESSQRGNAKVHLFDTTGFVQRIHGRLVQRERKRFVLREPAPGHLPGKQVPGVLPLRLCYRVWSVILEIQHPERNPVFLSIARQGAGVGALAVLDLKQAQVLGIGDRFLVHAGHHASVQGRAQIGHAVIDFHVLQAGIQFQHLVDIVEIRKVNAAAAEPLVRRPQPEPHLGHHTVI